jgi:hypothetical protein
MPRIAMTRQLTGPAAAAVLGLDGFRDHDWPLLYCVDHTGRGDLDTIRVRNLGDPLFIDGLNVATHATVLRHLAEVLVDCPHEKGLTIRDRIEFALEHCLRDGFVDLSELRIRGSRRYGDALLHELLDLRRFEPAAESYAEVQGIQMFRDWGLRVFRQIPVIERGRIQHRIDVLVTRDEKVVRPKHLLSGPLEVFCDNRLGNM